LLTDERVVSFGKLNDEIVGIGSFSSLDDFLIRATMDISIGDVISNRIIKEDRLLCHQSDLISQGLKRDLSNVVTIDENLALLDIIESGQEIDQRGLAGSTHSHQGDHFSHVYMERDVFEDGFLSIFKGNVLKIDPL
jgi:hypothetical protein